MAHQPFYISNTILVFGSDRQLLDEIVLRPEVAAIGPNRRHQVAGRGPSPRASAAPRAIEPNITFVGADSAWMLGATGSGIVVAVNDTGVDEDHPAIARHYRGCLDPPSCTIEDHDHAWWDATGVYPSDPTDINGHGTSNTGIVVGDDGGGNQIGMAPGAITVHCKMIDDLGYATNEDILECLQWDLAPWDLAGANPEPNLAPDIVNLSWGLSGGGAVQIRDGIRALNAAGIMVVAAAGNGGPACATLVSPGDFREALTVGAVDHGPFYPGELVWFSSRGPSDVDPSPPDYFPDVLAPGLDIRTSAPGGEWSWFTSTAASTAHVSGLAALVWSAAPLLRGHVGVTADLIRTTATPLTGSFGSSCGGDYVDGPNNDWGSGTIQAEEAVRLAMIVNGSLIFLDGFDQGSAAAWSTTFP